MGESSDGVFQPRGCPRRRTRASLPASPDPGFHVVGLHFLVQMIEKLISFTADVFIKDEPRKNLDLNDIT